MTSLETKQNLEEVFANKSEIDFRGSVMSLVNNTAEESGVRYI